MVAEKGSRPSGQTAIRSGDPKLNLIFQFIMRYPRGGRIEAAKGEFTEDPEESFSIRVLFGEEGESSG